MKNLKFLIAVCILVIGVLSSCKKDDLEYYDPCYRFTFDFEVVNKDGANLLDKDVVGNVLDQKMSVTYKDRIFDVALQKPENDMQKDADHILARFYGAYLEDVESVGLMIMFGDVDLLSNKDYRAEVELKISDKVYHVAAKYNEGNPFATLYLNGKEINGDKFVIEY